MSEVDWEKRFEECVENGYHKWEVFINSSPRATSFDAYIVCEHCRAQAYSPYNFRMTKYKGGR